jgi:regulator of nucleoside diphosphate kinase
LRSLLRGRGKSAFRDQAHLQELRSELEQAIVLDAAEVPADVITMDTRVEVLDLETGDRRHYELVFPADADISANRISVLAPLGTALLGYREGDEFEWLMPGGLRRLRIERVTQPVAELDTANRPLALEVH